VRWLQASLPQLPRVLAQPIDVDEKPPSDAAESKEEKVCGWSALTAEV
jgi:hypothetical protein